MDIAGFLIVYGILFIGELGDKTQLIVFNLALEYKKFYKVGIGATLGFAVIVTIGILFGSLITEFVPLGFISLISGLLFIAIGLIELRNIKSLYLLPHFLSSLFINALNPTYSFFFVFIGFFLQGLLKRNTFNDVGIF